MSAIFRLASRAVVQRQLAANRALLPSSRTLKTSQKKDDTASLAVPTPATKEEFANPNPKNWVSYGYDFKDETHDRTINNWTFFTSVTLCLVWGTWYWSYLPDTQSRDWAQREGFLELRRREKAGVDLVNPNYIDPAKIQLPSDEDLEGVEIII